MQATHLAPSPTCTNKLPLLHRMLWRTSCSQVCDSASEQSLLLPQALSSLKISHRLVLIRCSAGGRWTADSIPDLEGNTYVVTGATSGIGFQAAKAGTVQPSSTAASTGMHRFWLILHLPAGADA